MNIKKFMNQVEQCKDLVPLGVAFKETDSKTVSHFIVKHRQTKLEVKLPIEAVEKSEWETLYDVMSGKREPSVLQHMSRVVGYFSKTENWNPSKIGELKDRQDGDYKLEESK